MPRQLAAAAAFAADEVGGDDAFTGIGVVELSPKHKSRNGKKKHDLDSAPAGDGGYDPSVFQTAPSLRAANPSGLVHEEEIQAGVGGKMNLLTDLLGAFGRTKSDEARSEELQGMTGNNSPSTFDAHQHQLSVLGNGAVAGTDVGKSKSDQAFEENVRREDISQDGAFLLKKCVCHLLKLIGLMWLIVVLYIMIRNPISSPHCKRIPRVYASILVDFLFIGSAIAVALVTFNHIGNRPHVRFGSFKKIFLFYASLVVPMTALPCVGVALFNPDLGTNLWVFSIPIMVITGYLMLKKAGRTAVCPKSADPPIFRKQNAKLAFAFVQVISTFFFGYYVIILYAERFGTWARMVKKEFGVGIVLMITECVLAFMLFSVIFPFYDRVMITWNFAFDVIKFTYGRGVLFKVSTYFVFYMILWKDICYALWHFALKFHKWVIVFVVKIFNKNGSTMDKLSPKMMLLMRTIELTVYLMGVPKMLVRQWEPLCDFTQLEVDPSLMDDDDEDNEALFANMGSSGGLSFGLGRGPRGAARKNFSKREAGVGERTSLAAKFITSSMGGKLVKEPDPTGLGLRLTFANVSIRVHNLPAELKQDMQSLVLDKTDDAYDEKADDAFGVLEGIEQERKKQQIAAGKRKPEDDRPKTGPMGYMQKKKKDSKPPGTGTILEPVFEEPVNQAEIARLRNVISFVQTHIFMRFQVRSCAKLYTSLLFVFVPLISEFIGNSSYSPGFIAYTDVATDKRAEMQLVAGLSFLFVDAVEWAWLTSLAFRNADEMRKI
eukprot:g1841.t1